jgi:hypothetical protein
VHFAAIVVVLFAKVVCVMRQRTVVYPSSISTNIALPPATTRTETHRAICKSGGTLRSTLKILCKLDYEVAKNATKPFLQEYGGSVAQRGGGGGGGNLRVESYVNSACRSFTNRWQLDKFIRTNLSDIVGLQVAKEIEALGHRSWVRVHRVSIFIDGGDMYTVKYLKQLKEHSLLLAV